MKTFTKVAIGAAVVVGGILVYRRLSTPTKPKTLGGALGDLFDSGRNLFDIIRKDKSDKPADSPISGIAADDSAFGSVFERTDGSAMQPANVRTYYQRSLGGTVESDPFNPLETPS
jgi:hypothetical protein